MITLLIAVGGNDIEIPCRVFENLESAIEECDKIFGFESIIGPYGTHVYNKSMDPNDIDDDGERISSELFIKYYYGCGGPHCFELKEVDFNTKFISWDLD